MPENRCSCCNNLRNNRFSCISDTARNHHESLWTARQIIYRIWRQMFPHFPAGCASLWFFNRYNRSFSDNRQTGPCHFYGIIPADFISNSIDHDSDTHFRNYGSVMVFSHQRCCRLYHLSDPVFERNPFINMTRSDQPVISRKINFPYYKTHMTSFWDRITS